MGRGFRGKRRRRGGRDGAGDERQSKKPSTDGDGSKGKKKQQRDDRDFRSNLVPFSERFNTYYQKQELVPPEEWDAFLQTLQRQLPTSFRVNQSSIFAPGIRRKLQSYFPSKYTDVVVEDGEVVPELYSYMPWYPNKDGFKLNISRRQLRKTDQVKEFHQWLISQTDAGCVTRQEEVSMIPPFLLDVKPHHRVLDMCAAPGSKTSQLVEMLHSEEIETGKPPTGYVVANDADTKRAYMLVHQLKRINSPYMLVSCHEGQRFPNIYRSRKEKRGMFDRILCDVPCSGDGTLRKCPDIWRKWDLSTSISLHALQVQIAMRAASLLEVGGFMVYSTCTFNPYEDEAVIASVLKRCKGAIELVDISDRLKGLKTRPGRYSWKVMDREFKEYESFEDVPEDLRRKFREGLFPPTLEDAKRLRLERCWRLLPQDQDTGGFFICLLQKVCEIPQSSNFNSGGSSKQEADNGDKTEDVEKVEEEDVEEVIDAVEVAAKVDQAMKEDDEEEIAGSKEADEEFEEKEPGQKQGYAYRRDPSKRPAQHNDAYVQLDDEKWESLKGYYGFDGTFPRDLLYTRSSTVKTITLAANPVKGQLLDADNEKRMRVVYTGVKILEKNTRQEPDSVDCSFRLTQEGLHLLLPYITRRKVPISISEYQMLLDQRGKYVAISEFSEEVQSVLEPLSVGCVLLVLKDEDQRKANVPLHSTTLESTAFALSAWRGRKNFNLLVTKQDCEYIISQLKVLGLYTESKAAPANHGIEEEKEDGEIVEGQEEEEVAMNEEN